MRKVWFREISTPSIDSLDVYDDYRSWESCRGSKIPKHIKNTFEKTKKIRNARLPFEEKIKVGETHSFESPDYSVHQNWIDYLDWEIKKQVILVDPFILTNTPLECPSYHFTTRESGSNVSVIIGDLVSLQQLRNANCGEK